MVKKTKLNNSKKNNSKIINQILIIISLIIFLIIIVAIFYPAITGNATYLIRKTQSISPTTEPIQSPPTTEPPQDETLKSKETTPTSSKETETSVKKVEIPSTDNIIKIEGIIYTDKNTKVTISRTFFLGIIKIPFINLEVSENNFKIDTSSLKKNVNIAFYDKNFESIYSTNFPASVISGVIPISPYTRNIEVISSGITIVLNVQQNSGTE